MPIYLYETIPSKKGEKPRQFELKQSMKDPALTTHPDTGESIRRVVTGGFGLMSSNAKPPQRGHSCGAGCRH